MSYSKSGNSVSNSTAYTKFDAPSEPERDEFCWGLCCFKGCIIGAVGLAYFFLIIPAGILLIFHGMNKNVSLTIALGSLVLIVPTCIVIPGCLAVKYYRAIWKDRDNENRSRKKTYQYDNPFKSETELQV